MVDHNIIIQLWPSKLANPDLDLRYDIPDQLASLSENDFQITDDGFDYSEDMDNINLFLTTTDLELFKKKVLDYLTNNQILNNDILSACKIAHQTDEDQYETLYAFDKTDFSP